MSILTNLLTTLRLVVTKYTDMMKCKLLTIQRRIRDNNTSATKKKHEIISIKLTVKLPELISSFVQT